MTVSIFQNEYTLSAFSEAITVYEFPLNERIRTLLRLEDLFLKFSVFLKGEHRFEHHSALMTLFEIVDVGSRADLKSDLLQELERQNQSLQKYREHPDINQTALNDTLHTIEQTASNLNHSNGRLGYNLRENEFLMLIRSRSAIPGGVCRFDLPSYHRWQFQPPETRRADMQTWLEPMKSLLEATQLILKFLRHSGTEELAVAKNGSFTQHTSEKTFQMLCVALPTSLPVVPEFSANKHMIWIRFNIPNEHGVGSKNTPHTDTFEFKIRLCNL